ncbi:hypothetical protein FBU59_000808 [Linderina macrospora]|uniref:Uncharacterized protein n=1 Tax=Linderina macrospora TaxID=4868 RepID=A0ACC1JFT0_9FUNG|nr:hypothetical protein FBU59_000808 [Linderina macrospora]
MDEGRSEQFTVIIRESAVVNMGVLAQFCNGSPALQIQDIQSALNALDLIFGSVAHREMVGFGRSFFTCTQSTATQHGLELWRGFSLSVRPGEGKLFLNINTAVTAMYTSGPLIPVIHNVLGVRNDQSLCGFDASQTRKLATYLHGLPLLVKHRGINSSCKVLFTGFTKNPLNKEAFDWEDPQHPGHVEKITIAEYYRRRYNLRLAHPHLPGLRGRLGVVFPIELCEVAENQRYRGVLNERQTADMVRFACQRPNENRNRIIEVLAQLRFNDNPVVRAFGLTLQLRLSEVDSRVLPAPAISYHQSLREATITPSGGAWNMRDKRVMGAGVPLDRWAVLVMANSRMVPQNSIERFVTALVHMCNTTGYNIRQPRPPIRYGNPNADLSRELSTTIDLLKLPKNEYAQLVLIVLPSTNSHMYQAIKNAAYTTHGVQTQCMQSKHVQKANLQYCANLCLKINAKLGGTNQSLPQNVMQTMLHKQPTLFLGCDVTHPAPGEGNRPSMAAVVGSVDSMGLRYAATLIQLPSRQEIVSRLQEVVVRHLKLFYKCTRMWPKRIIFYRDGVSETQFAQVREREIIEINRGCASLEHGYQPQVTFLAVLKRHNTRFFPNGRDSDRTGNCVPGTVVDTTVTLPSMTNFYLFAHAAIQGTSRPTHYYVLHDDAKFTQDEIQQLTYHLCYTYAICTRSVSLVPPVYYAHRVADPFEEAVPAPGSSHGGAGTRIIGQGLTNSIDPNQTGRILQINERLDETMYFM